MLSMPRRDKNTPKPESKVREGRERTGDGNGCGQWSQWMKKGRMPSGQTNAEILQRTRWEETGEREE